MDSRIRESFDKQGLMATLGARIESVQKGCVILSAPIRAEASQQHGFAHAGVTFALGDSAAGYSALTTMPDGAEVLTAEMKINLLAPADGERLIARGEVMKLGRRLVVTRATVETEYADGSRKLVAILQGTMVPLGTETP